MITFIVHLKVRPENAAAFEDLMHQVVVSTRQNEPGVIHYDFAKSVDEADTYLVVEVYADTESHAAHMRSTWVQSSLPKSMRLIEGAPRIRQYVSSGSEPVTERARMKR